MIMEKMSDNHHVNKLYFIRKLVYLYNLRNY
jgi:hypothetical protein